MPRQPSEVHLHGPKLRAARERAELSQRALGLLAGIDQAMVSRWEGRSSVRLETPTADRLAVALRCSRNALLDKRYCQWCGMRETRPANPLLRVGDDWAHRVSCFDAMASARAGVR